MSEWRCWHCNYVAHNEVEARAHFGPNSFHPPECLNDPYRIGDQVEKYTGDYHLKGEVRAVFSTKAGKIRYVVEHEPGFLHIYSGPNIRKVLSGDYAVPDGIVAVPRGTWKG